MNRNRGINLHEALFNFTDIKVYLLFIRTHTTLNNEVVWDVTVAGIIFHVTNLINCINITLKFRIHVEKQYRTYIKVTGSRLTGYIVNVMRSISSNRKVDGSRLTGSTQACHS